MLRDENDPVERVKRLGLTTASPVDLLAIGFSRTEADAASAEGMARTLITRYENLRSFGDAASSDLQSITGLDSFEVLRAHALIEIGRKIALAGKGPSNPMDDAEKVVEEIVRRLNSLKLDKRENFFAVLLDSKNEIIRIALIHVGTLNMSLVGPREVFREAIRDGASSIIVVHNHPSGDPTPSPEDVDVTQRLVEIGEILDIPLQDHVILGENTFTSFHRERLM